ncbi:MAG: hypothetical protein HZC22_03495 [Rhodocyclales bacterium]|nr:hypothetical protein [Rhodocyclales bacterium]
MAPRSNTQSLTILAQDPAVRANGALLLEQVSVPQEYLTDGPTGYRIKVVDFDASANVRYQPRQYEFSPEGIIKDPFAPPAKPTPKQRRAYEQRLLQDPTFHAQNVYAIAMRTLSRFEFALGRRVAWGFSGHQLHIVPHAFAEANAYYSEEDRALMFGYFVGKSGKHVFTCLSHDIVAHETTHAILDGLRTHYTDPSGPDQAGFHEGFADIVALLSVFSLKPVVERALSMGEAVVRKDGMRLVKASQLTPEALSQTILFGIGKEFGQQMEGFRANALRRSVGLKPSTRYLAGRQYEEPHDRGEVLAGAILRSFLELWAARIGQLGTFGRGLYNMAAVVEEGAKVADHLLTIVIRATDYVPSVDLEFADFLAAMLTVDAEVVPDDSRFSYRDVILRTFRAYGIKPPPQTTDADGRWRQFARNGEIQYRKTNFESMLRDPEEVFRFVWENREVLNVDSRGYTKVVSVRPSVRQGPDGFTLRETICEYVQVASLFGAELESVLHIKRPAGMSTQQRLTVYGGAVLVFDQYGSIKYHIERPLADVKRQKERLDYLWRTGAIEQPGRDRNQFAELHRARAMREFSAAGPKGA